MLRVCFNTTGAHNHPVFPQDQCLDGQNRLETQSRSLILRINSICNPGLAPSHRSPGSVHCYRDRDSQGDAKRGLPFRDQKLKCNDCSPIPIYPGQASAQHLADHRVVVRTLEAYSWRASSTQRPTRYIFGKNGFVRTWLERSAAAAMKPSPAVGQRIINTEERNGSACRSLVRIGSDRRALVVSSEAISPSLRRCRRRSHK